MAFKQGEVFAGLSPGKSRQLLIAFAALIAFGAAMLFVAFPVFGYKLDHVCFLVTGKRLIDLDLELLYTPTGMGPWAYMPPAAIFFGPFAAFGMETGSTLSVLFNFACLALLLFLHVRHYCVGARPLREFALMAVVVAAYFFIIWETLNLGQIDVFLTLLASLFLFGSLSAPASGGLLAVLVNFKPQFAIYSLLAVYRRGLLVILWAALAFAAIAGVYVLLTLVVGKPGLYLEQLVQYKNVAGAITQSKDVTNQSLDGALRRMLTAGDYWGRYVPVWYAPAKVDIHLLALPDSLVSVISAGLRAAFVALAAGALWLSREGGKIPQEFFFIILTIAIPVLSPLFWQAHMIQLLPVSAWLLLRATQSGQWLVVVCAVAALVATAVGNPAILGAAGADTVQAYSIYTIAILLQAALCLSFPLWRRAR